MSDQKKPQKTKSKSSPLKLLVFLAIATMATAIVYSFIKPQDLTDIKGYESPTHRAEWKVRQKPDDIRQLLQQAAATNTPLTITEEQINKWLRRNIIAQQNGPLKNIAKAKGLWVRLKPGRIEIIIERSLSQPTEPNTNTNNNTTNTAETTEAAANTETHTEKTAKTSTPTPPSHPHNLSLFLDIEKTNRSVTINRPGGRFGNLSFTGPFKGYQFLVMPAFQSIADHFQPELDLIQNKLTHITIEEDRITLKKLDIRQIVK